MLENIRQIHLRILSLYARDYLSKHSMLEITKLLSINYSNAFKRIKELVEWEILNEEKTGKSCLLSLNLKNEQALHIISYVEQMDAPKTSAFEDIMREIILIDPFASIGLFGSRARGNAKKDSDWDVFVITARKDEAGKIMSRFPFVKDVHLLILDTAEFEESLHSAEETVVKHIIRNKKMLYNPYPFYNIIKKWEHSKHAPA